MRQRGAVLDDEGAHPLHQLRAIAGDGAVGADDPGLGIHQGGIALDGGDVRFPGAVALVDEDDIGHAEVGFAGVVGQLMARAQGVGDADVEVAAVERQVVVAAVPQDHVRLLLRGADDLLIVHASVDHEAVVDVRLVLLPLLDGALVLVEVGVAREALAGLAGQVPVGHGVADGHHLLAELLEDVADGAGGLALARTRAHGGDADDGLRRGDHRLGGAQEGEVAVMGDAEAGQVHGGGVGNIRVGEDGLLDALAGDEGHQLGLVHDGDALRVELPGQHRRVAAALDARDLGGREGHHLIVRVVPVDGIEVVEVASRGSQDHHASCRHDTLPLGPAASRHAQVWQSWQHRDGWSIRPLRASGHRIVA